MFNRDLLRLVPWDTINSALAIDAKVLSTEPQRYIKENADTYDIAINTWLHCIKLYAPYSWTYVAVQIGRDGLAATVDYFCDAAIQCINDITIDEQRFPLASAIWEEILAGSRGPIRHAVYQSNLTPDGTFLFLCRYLKRLTPLRADVLSQQAIQDFKRNQQRLKNICRRGYNPLIIDACRAEVDAGLLNSRTRKYSSILMKDIELSPGTCFSLDGKRLKTLYDKVDSLIREYDFNHIEVWRSSVWGYNLGNECVLMTVPKSIKSARTIAPEQCLRQAIAHRMFSLRTRTPEGIDLEDQTRNQVAAKEGSETGSWSTIDLSHASDDVTWVLVQEIYRDFPLYLDFLSRIRPSYVKIQDKRLLLQSFATMGNSMTFLVESEVFYIIAKAAIHFAQRLGYAVNDDIIVYGDDIVVHERAFPWVVSFLEALGFNINTSKSFSEGGFRESCGKDYICGEDVTSPYFPRAPLATLLNWSRNRNSECITVAESLISLQHRLMDVCPPAAQFVELYLREHRSDLGYRPIGTQDNVLWAYDDIPTKYRYIPEFHLQTELRSDPWVFRNHMWHYCPEKTVVAKTPVQDEIHRVKLYSRPKVEVEHLQLPEDILYLQYLAEGPYYQSVLDRQLGISTSRRSIPAGRPRSTWVVSE